MESPDRIADKGMGGWGLAGKPLAWAFLAGYSERFVKGILEIPESRKEPAPSGAADDSLRNRR